MRNLDFSSWQGLLSTVVGLVLITLLGVGLRLLAMHTVQQRRERENRQINERLRTLIAAYKTLGGSFTGTLSVAPTHLRDLRRHGRVDASAHDLDENAEHEDDDVQNAVVGQFRPCAPHPRCGRGRAVGHPAARHGRAGGSRGAGGA